MVNLSSVKMVKNFFTSMECDQLIENAETAWFRQPATIQNESGTTEDFQQNDDYRSTTLFYPKTDETALKQRLYSFIRMANEAQYGWQFQLNGMYENPNIMLYEDSQRGHYDMHLDIGVGRVSLCRKISYSILLNPNEYEGGELVFQIGREPNQMIDQSHKGSIILFPSYMLHAVKTVTKGKRYAMVGWVHGDPFR